jgi:hypothetical protein
VRYADQGNVASQLQGRPKLRSHASMAARRFVLNFPVKDCFPAQRDEDLDMGGTKLAFERMRKSKSMVDRRNETRNEKGEVVKVSGAFLESFLTIHI